MLSRIVLLSLLFTVSAAAGPWQTVCEDDFDATKLGGDWLSLKGQWRTKNGALVAARDSECELRLNRKWSGPVRVEYDCWFPEGAAGISDLSVYIGRDDALAREHAGFYGFASNNNQGARIAGGALPPGVVPGGIVKPGVRYHVAAESNGTILTLRVNGKTVVQEIIRKPLSEGFVHLYTWRGGAHFDNLRISVKDGADGPNVILEKKTVGMQQNHPSRFAESWNPTKLAISDRKTTVDTRRVTLRTDAVRDDAGGWPVVFGVPLPAESLWNVSQARIVTDRGEVWPASMTPTATWTPAGSLRWVLIDTTFPQDGSLWFEFGKDVQAAGVVNPLTVEPHEGSVMVDTGRMQVRFAKSASIIETVTLRGREVLAGKGSLLYHTDQNGITYGSATPTSIVVEHQTANRAVIRARGDYVNDQGKKACTYDLRVYLYRDQPTIKLFTTWTINVDTDTMQWRDLGVRIPFSTASALFDDTRVDASGAAIVAEQTAIRSAGIEQSGATLWQGRHLPGWVHVTGPAGGMTVAVTDMAGQFPNALEVDSNGVTFHGFLRRNGRPLGFRREDVRADMGEATWQYFDEHRFKDPPLATRYSNGLGLAKTHELTLTFRLEADAELSARRTASLALEPPLIYPDPAYACDTLAFGPCHPYDPERFGEVEKKIDQAFEEWLHVTSHLHPHTGFYDHGRGVPHHVKKRTSADGEDEFYPDGYRRNYDLGYGNPIVPWMMYLRSGSRRWLDVGVAMARHEMDIRLVHPTDPPSRFLVASKYWHYGSWAFDGSNCSYQDNWYWNLALCFYTTGYQRAMDVYGEFTTSLHNAVFVDQRFNAVQPGDRTNRPSILGSLGVYYKATWDHRARQLLEAITPSVLATQRDDGRYDVRQEWMDYAMFQTTFGIPDPLPETREAFSRFGRANWRIPERVGTGWTHSPRSMWQFYQQTGDPQIAVAARRAIREICDPKLTFIRYDGLTYGWMLPVWMRLASAPNADEGVVPAYTKIAQAQNNTMRVEHEQGSPTRVEFQYLGSLRALDESGREVSGDVFTYDDELLIYELHVPADTRTRAIVLEAGLPERRDTYHNDALTYPWFPDGFPMTVKMYGDVKFSTELKPHMKATWLPDDARFPEGRFGRAVRVGGGGQRVDIPVKGLLDERQGTLEFWVRFERTLTDHGFGHSLIEVPGNPESPNPVMRFRARESWFATYWNVQGKRATLAYNMRPTIEPGRWYHIAWQWRMQDSGKVMRRFYLDGYPCGHTEGWHDGRTYWPNAMEPGQITGPMTLGYAGEHFASIDDLRISTEPRYPFGDVDSRTFEPPTTPHAFDEMTVLIYRADGQEQAIIAGGATGPVKYRGF